MILNRKYKVDWRGELLVGWVYRDLGSRLNGPYIQLIIAGNLWRKWFRKYYPVSHWNATKRANRIRQEYYGKVEGVG